MSAHQPYSILLLSKAIIVSILLHFILFNLFTFIIPVKKAPFKPNLIFLGAILEYHDIANTSSSSGLKLPNLNLKEKTIIRYQTAETLAPRKPRTAKISAMEQKQLLKTVFELPDISEEPEDQSLIDMGIDPNFSPFKSLRKTSPDDQN